VTDVELRECRDAFIERLNSDMEDIVFKFRDVFRVMERHCDNWLGTMLATFEKYIYLISYEEELLDHVTTLLMDSIEIMTL
jgi:hypothetical protein